MREPSNHARKNGMRLFVPVAEYSFSRFAVSVRQIASRTVGKSSGTLRLSLDTWRDPGLAGTATGFVPEERPTPHASAKAWGYPRPIDLRVKQRNDEEI